MKHTFNIQSVGRYVLPAVIAGAVACIASATSSHAAAIIWGPAMDITGDFDVTTKGSLVGAFNVGDGGVPGATVNGVNFQPFAIDSTSGPVSNVSVGNFNLATSSNVFASDNTFYGSTSTPFSDLSTNYQTILQSSTITGAPDTFTLTMSGLNIGRTYTFQWWSNTSAPGAQLHRSTSVNGVTLIDNTTGVEGGLGQYAIGTFVADSTSQQIVFSPVPPGAPSFAQLNAFQLRVPEPAAVLAGLLPLGVCVFGVVFRRRATTLR